MLTGLSLSFCVLDIQAGLVSLDEVEKITAGIRAADQETIDWLLNEYCQSYWRENPEACEAIARQLFTKDLVYQPRLHNELPPFIGVGHWQQDGHLVDPKTRQPLD
jgi:hypothetical protein